MLSGEKRNLNCFASINFSTMSRVCTSQDMALTGHVSRNDSLAGLFQGKRTRFTTVLGLCLFAQGWMFTLPSPPAGTVYLRWPQDVQPRAPDVMNHVMSHDVNWLLNYCIPRKKSSGRQKRVGVRNLTLTLKFPCYWLILGNCYMKIWIIYWVLQS